MKIAATLFIAICFLAPNCCAYESGDKFISKDGYIWELEHLVPIYAKDDSCLQMMEQGFLIHCEPTPIKHSWRIIIHMHGARIEALVDEEYLEGLLPKPKGKK
jgi:hypothetical protein